MYELLWLLLPVAAASGWFAARRSARRNQQAGRNEFSRDYFRGLNFLLNEQPDKAIEVFVQMLEVDSDTVETHLALGNLFRRRGEVDRAIRIHQNLIARPTLSREQRAQALLELSQDYMRAGLFDRAESLLLELLDNNLHTRPALRHLLDIYQQEKEWDRAIDIARRLESETGRGMKPVIAQFHCEQAEEALGRGDLATATGLIKRALGHDRRCVRATLLQAGILMRGRQYKAAIKTLRRVEEQDPDFIPEILEPLRQCHEALGTLTALRDYLDGLAERYPGISPVLAEADLLCEQEGDDAAVRFLAEQLRQKPSVQGLARLIDLQAGTADGKVRDDLEMLGQLVDRLLEGRPVYQCRRCGFEGKSLHWQCPGCKEWNTVKPIQGVIGE